MGREVFGRCSLEKHSTTLRGAAVEVKSGGSTHGAHQAQDHRLSSLPARPDLLLEVGEAPALRDASRRAVGAAPEQVPGRWQLELGGGTIPAGSFEILKADVSRALRVRVPKAAQLRDLLGDALTAAASLSAYSKRSFAVVRFENSNSPPMVFTTKRWSSWSL